MKDRPKMTLAVLAEIVELQAKLDKLRHEFGVSAPGEPTTHYTLGTDDTIIVEANGVGGGLLSVVGHNYPWDYMSHYSHPFDSEDEAAEAADWLSQAYDEDRISFDDFFDALKQGKKPWLEEDAQGLVSAPGAAPSSPVQPG